MNETTHTTRVLELLTQVNAIIPNSHIVYTSGRHGRAYVNKDAIYPHTHITSELCRLIAEQFAEYEIDVVVAPALGAILLSQWVAYHLSQTQKKTILAVYAEKTPEGFTLSRGYDTLCRGKKVLVIEDIINTGGSLKKVIQTLRALPAEIVAAACICNRGEITTQDLENIPQLYSLSQIKLESWAAQECPLCEQGISVNTNVGKGKEFLRSRSQIKN